MSDRGRAIFAAVLSIVSTTAAHGAKSCETLKAEIAAKIDANGVQVYTLEIVPADRVGSGQKVVGSCDGGRSRIVYRRGQQV